MPNRILKFLSTFVFGKMTNNGVRLRLTQYPKEITNSIGMKLILIPRGTFKMGLPISGSDLRVHRVTITRDYYLGATQVTQVQYER